MSTNALTLDRTRELLGVAPWQIELAATAGLLHRHPSGGFHDSSVRAAKARRRAWLNELEAEYRLTSEDAARRLSMSPKAFARAAADAGLTPVTVLGRKQLFFRAGDIDRMADGDRDSKTRKHHVSIRDLAADHDVTEADVIRAAKAVHARVQRQSDGSRTVMASREPDIARELDGRTRTKTSRGPSEADLVAAKVRVLVRNRADSPTAVTLHLGPTNSGKTYDALRRLAHTRSGVYAAPLRMLAREAYEKMVAVIGGDNVGLITGEEAINPDAPVICCTAEMAPTRGSMLVLDEAHWAADPDRGYAWTRLLVGGAYESIEVAASRGARAFLEHVLADADYLVTEEHDRLSPLKYGGLVNLSDIPDRALVVAFSRKAVHALAKRLINSGRKVGVLYGALPPETRVEQISAFIDGDVDVLVTTDVVGHGINTPAEAVVFAQTDKFDGSIVRDLRVWEAAQIAGRAGRYGLGGAGTVYTLAGEPGFTPKPQLVAAGARAAAGLEPDGLAIERGLLRPTHPDLGDAEGHQLGVALTAWRKLAEAELADREGIEPVPVEPLHSRWAATADIVGARRHADGLTAPWPFTGDIAWKIVTTPVDTESPAFEALVRSLAEYRDRFEPVLATARTLANADLDQAEAAAQTARDLLIVARAFPDIRATLGEEAARIESAATRNIERRLASALRTSGYGECDTCGQPCAPHFKKCDECHTTTTDRPGGRGRRAGTRVKATAGRLRA